MNTTQNFVSAATGIALLIALIRAFARASKTVDAPYNAANSMGSNLGPTNKALIERVKGDVDKLQGGERLRCRCQPTW